MNTNIKLSTEERRHERRGEERRGILANKTFTVAFRGEGKEKEYMGGIFI